MSWKAENWLAENCDLAFGVPRALLFAMANQANDEGSLMAKNGTYMKRLNVTERSVQRATAALVKGGWIKKIPDYSEDGRQLCNVYRIVMPSTVGGGRVTPASPPRVTSAVTLPVTPSVTPRVTSAVTPIKNQTDNPHGESLTPPTPLPGGAASSARVTAAERTARAGLQELTERLWREQHRHIDRKLGRAIKARLRAGEAVDDLWADYFEPREPDYWDPPFTDLSAAVDALRRVAARLKASDQVSEHSWCTWIAPLRAVDLDLDTKVLTVAFPSRHGHDHLVQMLGAILREQARADGLSDLKFWQPHRRAA